MNFYTPVHSAGRPRRIGCRPPNPSSRATNPRNPTLKDFADGLASIDGLKVKVTASGNVLLKNLFSNSESSSRLSANVFRLHHLEKGLKPINTDEVRHALSSIPSVSVQQLGTPEDRYFQIRLADDGKYEDANKELRSIINTALNAAYGIENIAVISTDFVGSRFSSSLAQQAIDDRSEERRVGKECRSRWSPYH